MKLLIFKTSVFIILLAVMTLSEQDQTVERSGQNFYSVENTKLFSDHLREQGDFLRAAEEYDRLIFLTGYSQGFDSVFYYAGLCYLKGGNINKAVDRFLELQNYHKHSTLVPATRYYIAKSKYLFKDWDGVIKFLNNSSDESEPDRIKNGKRNLLSLSFAHLDCWLEAESTACEGNSPETEELCMAIKKGKNLPYKSKLKAGFLSAFVPGLGKFYSKRKADGIFAFVTVGSFAWQSVLGFRKDDVQSVRGWAFGLLALGLHLGNIYGTAISVELYNRKVKQDYYQELETSLDYYDP